MSSRNYHYREALQQLIVEFERAEERAYDPPEVGQLRDHPEINGLCLYERGGAIGAWLTYDGPRTEMIQ